MYAEVVQKLQDTMTGSFTVDNLKTIQRDEFKNEITSKIGKIDSDVENYDDPDKQRDLSIKFCWGHDHDFGNFSLRGKMGSRHIHIIARFMAEYGLPFDLT